MHVVCSRWRLQAVIVKSNDDVRQELLAAQVCESCCALPWEFPASLRNARRSLWAWQR